MLVTSYDSDSDSDYDCHSAITASSVGSFTRKGSGTPSHLRCIVEVDGEKPTLTTTNSRAPSLPGLGRQRRPPPVGLRCVVDVSRDRPSLVFDNWSFTNANKPPDAKTPSSADSFTCKGVPFDDPLGSRYLRPFDEKPKKPPMSAPAINWTTAFREDDCSGPPPVNKTTHPRKSSLNNIEKKKPPRPLPPLPTIVTNLPSTKSYKHPSFDEPPDYSLIDPSPQLHCVKASRRKGGLFSPLPDDGCSPRTMKQIFQGTTLPQHSSFDVQPSPLDDEGPPRTMRQKIKNGFASVHGKTNSADSATRKAFGDASSRNNSLEGGQPRKISLPKAFRKRSTGSRKKSLPSAWFDDDERTDGSSDEEWGVTLVVPAGIQYEQPPPSAQTNNPFDPGFSFSRRCMRRPSVSEAPTPRRYL